MSCTDEGLMIPGWLVAILIAIAAGPLAILADAKRTHYRRLRVEAVERGYAEWAVDNEGNATWRWKESNGNNE